MPGQRDKRTLPFGPKHPRRTSGAPSELNQRYDILGEVGEGGMGVVYRARDRETGDTVAVKVLKPEIASRPELIERFKAELLLARRITHKNVCRTYELLRFGDTVAIAMEYVEGESLREFLNRYQTVPLRKGLEWAGQVCAGLDEAHSQAIVHRDLKPENIHIDRHGQAKVMDFGIARSIETEATRTGTLIGTLAYMSPEQAEGTPPDARSDIYSLGHVLYEMFCGRRAFEADTPVALALKQVRETPPAPREVEPDLPVYLDAVIRRCLDKDPAKRFQSALELQAALGKSGESLAPPRGRVRWFWRARGVNRRLLRLAVALLALGTMAGLLYKVVWEHPLRFMHHESKVTSVAFSSHSVLLASASEDKTIKLWDTTTERELRTLTGHTRGVYSVAFSPDGRVLASGSGDGTVKLWEVGPGRELHTLTGHARAVYAVAFSPDGKWLASGSDDKTVKLWEVATGLEVGTLTGHSGSVSAVAFSPDGRWLASAGDDETIGIWDVRTRRQARTLKGHAGEVSALAFSPFWGGWLASASYDKTIKIWDVRTWSEYQILTGHREAVYCLAFRAYGNRLASGDAGGAVKLWDVATGRELETLATYPASVESVAFSEDMKFLASGTGDGSIRLLPLKD